MKVAIELPDTTICSFVNYVFYEADGGLLMGAKSIDSDEIDKARKAEETIGAKL